MLDPHFVIFASLLNLYGTGSYALDTLRGHTQPNRVSWLLWATAGFIAFAAQISQGVGLSAIFTFMTGFGPALVTIASFVNSKAYWRVTKFDLACGALSALALILWLITHTGNIAIIFSIFADGLAAIPTLIKAYRHPGTESSRVYGLAIIAATITLLTIQTWDFAHYGFPLYILIMCIVLFTLIKFPNWRPAKSQTP